MRILKPNEIDTQKMRGGLDLKPPKPTDYRLGGISGITRKVLVKDGHWLSYLPIYELQRNSIMDVFGCVSFADNNVDEILHKQLYGNEVNFNDRFLVVGSGTNPDVGNSPFDVAEWKRKNGVVFGEEKWPLMENMTKSEYYNNFVVPPELLKEGKQSLFTYDFNYELGECGLKGQAAYFIYTQNMLNNLQYSPVACSVYGQYTLDGDGYVATPNTNKVTHQIAVVDYEKDKCWWVFDSESMALVKFNWNYSFQFPVLKYLKKKNMQLYKKNGQSGICLKTYGEDTLLAFPDTLTWKTYTGGRKFDEVGGQYVAEWPYPIVGHFGIIKDVGATLPEIEE